ncbi:hypothetical protein [Prosthecomicrobium hirschii]|uniref:hypothetical protein n=1 Tax=Prosthecodimorpha hirschii TaxID=665126 RepID=UPI00221F603D|nr:hypothetical protein [Prosthecomicrobium hirschii]MCW1844205.1 hypothetical protein [Prosthecomicrobium hirschii]
MINQDMQWQPIEIAPENTWLRTKRAGEAGENVSKKVVHVHPEHCPEPQTEWVDREGRTTVTHHSFLAPTHWMPFQTRTKEAIDAKP